MAVTQQARVWKGVSAKLGDLFGRMKDIEVERRKVRGSRDLNDCRHHACSIRNAAVEVPVWCLLNSACVR